MKYSGTSIILSNIGERYLDSRKVCVIKHLLINHQQMDVQLYMLPQDV